MSLGSVKARNLSLDACYGSNKSSLWPSTVYLHLFQGDPTLGAPEITGGSYAPIAIANDTSHWPAAMGGLKVNGQTEVMTTSTGPWSAPATYFWLTDSATQVLPPAAPTVTNVGASGVANNQYVITALNAEGETTASGIGVTATANATLNGTNYNHIAWSSVSGAANYNVYKLVAGVFVLLANTASLTYNDQGAAVGTQTPPVSNTTMTLLDGGPLSTPVRVLVAGVIVQFLPNTIQIGTS